MNKSKHGHLIYRNWIGFSGSESFCSYLSSFGIISNAFSTWLWASGFHLLPFLYSASSQKPSIFSTDICRKTSLSSSVVKIVLEVEDSDCRRNINCIEITSSGRDSYIWLLIASYLSVSKSAQSPVLIMAWHLAILSFTTAFAYSISLCVQGV